MVCCQRMEVQHEKGCKRALGVRDKGCETRFHPVPISPDIARQLTIPNTSAVCSDRKVSLRISGRKFRGDNGGRF